MCIYSMTVCTMLLYVVSECSVYRKWNEAVTVRDEKKITANVVGEKSIIYNLS